MNYPNRPPLASGSRFASSELLPADAGIQRGSALAVLRAASSSPLVAILVLTLLGFPTTAGARTQPPTGAGPIYVDPPMAPAFGEWSSARLETAFTVVSTRNNAVFGFNTPELQLHLPEVDNSTYALVSMPAPRLLDADGNEVAFELERGLHDPETQIAEIRFLDASGEAPAAYSRAVGSLSVSFPSKVETHFCEPDGNGDVVGLQCLIDGSSVDMTDGVLPEAAPFAALEPVRAYDATGRQLQRDPMATTYVQGQDDLKRYGFHGDVHRVEIDTVSEWIEASIAYDVPIAAPLPASSQGAVVIDPRAVTVDPRSVVRISVAAEAPSGGLSAEALALDGALQALTSQLPQPLAIVTLTAMPPSFASLAAEANGRVEEWSWRAGALSEPTVLDTQWLTCKKGMSEGALDLSQLPRLMDDASQRNGGAGDVLQVVVGQNPCGSPLTIVTFQSGSQVMYDGDYQVVEP